jgi:hypothetical protein
MDRTTFLKLGSLLGGAGLLAPLALGSARRTTSTYDMLKADVGFNHLTNKEEKKPSDQEDNRKDIEDRSEPAYNQSRAPFSRYLAIPIVVTKLIKA